MYHYVIFDLDGTLLDTLVDIADSMNDALAGFGVAPYSYEEYKQFVGKGLDNLAYMALPPEHRNSEAVERCVAAMRKVYAQVWAKTTKPYDGITSMLTTLKKRGIRSAVFSNKAHEFTVAMATHFFGESTFEVILGGGKFPYKPDQAGTRYILDTMGAKATECLFVGDSDVDIATARNANIVPVCVTWGFRSVAELRAAGGQHFISTPEELFPLLDTQKP